MSWGNFAIVKKASFISLSRVVNLLGLLITTMILARYFSKSEFASYDQLWLIFNTITPVISFAFTSSIYFFGARENAGEYIKTIFLTLTIAGFVLTIFLFFLRFEISALLNNSKFAQNFIYFAPFLIFSISSLLLDAVLILKNQFKKLFAITLATTSSYLLVIVVAIFFKQTIPFIFVGLSVISFARFIYFGYVIKNFFPHSTLNGIRDLMSYASEIFMYSTPLIIAHIAGSLSRQVDKYIVANNFPAELYAIYTIGAKELPVVPLITSSFTAVIFPEISRLYNSGKNSEIVKLANDTIKSTSVVIVPIFVYLLFFSKEFILILFSEKYVESVAIFRIYLFFLPIRILIYSSILSALGRQKIYMLISFLDLTLNLTLGIALVKIIHIIGPAVAVVTSTYIETFFMSFLISRILGSKLSHLLPLKFLSLLFLSTFAIAFLCYLFGLFVPNLILRFLITGGIFALVYVAVLRFGILRDIKGFK